MSCAILDVAPVLNVPLPTPPALPLTVPTLDADVQPPGLSVSISLVQPVKMVPLPQPPGFSLPLTMPTLEADPPPPGLSVPIALVLPVKKVPGMPPIGAITLPTIDASPCALS